MTLVTITAVVIVTQNIEAIIVGSLCLFILLTFVFIVLYLLSLS